jgi:hypothetical protein
MSRASWLVDAIVPGLDRSRQEDRAGVGGAAPALRRWRAGSASRPAPTRRQSNYSRTAAHDDPPPLDVPALRVSVLSSFSGSDRGRHESVNCDLNQLRSSSAILMVTLRSKVLMATSMIYLCRTISYRDWHGLFHGANGSASPGMRALRRPMPRR